MPTKPLKKETKTQSKSPQKKMELTKPETRATRSKSVKLQPIIRNDSKKNEKTVPQPGKKAVEVGIGKTKDCKPPQKTAPKSVGEKKVVRYAKSALIAVIEVTEDSQFVQFSLCQVVTEWKKNQSSAKVQVYDMVKPLQFKLSKRIISIQDFQVLCPVEAKEKAGFQTISQAQKKQMAKMFDENVDVVKEKLGIVPDDSSDSSQSEKSGSSEEVESDIEMVKTQPRQIVRVQRKLAPTQLQKTAPKKARAATVSPVKDVCRQSSTVSIGKKRDQPPQKLNEVCPSPKSRKVKKLTNETRQDIKVTVKSSNDSNFRASSEAPIKAKKQPKKPTEFKLGKWNPSTEIVEQELEKLDDSDEEAQYKCCVKCNSRNVIRAILTKNKFLLRKVIYDQVNIPSLDLPWSVDCPKRPLQVIAERNDLEFMREFCDVVLDSENHLGVQQNSLKLQQFFVNKRPQIKRYLLEKIDTGFVSKQAYGTHIRKVEIARGNRQGNNAFMDETHISNSFPNLFAGKSKWQIYRTLTVQFFKAFTLTKLGACSDIDPDGDDGITAKIAEIARTGNREFLEFLIGPCVKFENYGFNQLHHDVLKLDKLTEKYHTTSITKKAFSNKNITPLHLAAINPNEEVIETLLNQNPEINVTDDHLWKPIHYAAACVGPGPIKILLKKGANLNDLTNQKLCALHIAAQMGRAQNIVAILADKPALVKARDKKKLSAMAYALKLGEIEPILAFLDSKLVKINSGHGEDRMTSLHYAAAQGNYDMCKILLERKPKARVMSKDKFKRIPLTLAMKNGHVKVASLLLQEGSDWNHPDSSNNTPLHYAAGYGWQECIDLLLKHGANINSENSWRVTPITIAMLKNHQGIVKTFLKHDQIDVNGKDDQGRTLLTMALVDLTDNEVVEFVKYLINKGANINTQDLKGNTPLHLLAQYTSQLNHQDSQLREKVDRENENLIKVIKLFLENGASISTQNKDGQTPFSLALAQKRINVLDFFTENVKISENLELLHQFKDFIFDERYLTIFYKLLARDEAQLKASDFNLLDSQGFSVFLAYIQSWTLQYQIIYSRVEAELQNQFKIHNQQTDLYNFTQKELNDPFRAEFLQKNYPDQFAAYQSQHINNWYTSFNAKLRKQMCRKFIVKLYEQPFVDLLKYLVKNGADPMSKVVKLQYYRQLEEQRNKILNDEQFLSDDVIKRGVDADVVMIDTSNQLLSETKNQADPDKVKTRIEAIKEQKFVDQVLKRSSKKGRLTKEQRRQLKEKVLKRLSEVKEEIKKNCNSYVPRFKQVDGKTVEIEFNETHGLRNAVHLLMDKATKVVFNYLVDDLKVPIDELSYNGTSPFYVQVKNRINQLSIDSLLGECVEKLIKLGAKIDNQDQQGQTPFLLLYSNQNSFCQQAAEYLRQKGANVNQVSKSGIFALKIALVRRNNEEIKRLVGIGADINLVDNNGRNVLHEAINMSSAGADATFETEQILIDLGIDINKRDNFGRVPLHYAFVKMEDRPETREFAPISSQQQYSQSFSAFGGINRQGFGMGGFAGSHNNFNFGHNQQPTVSNTQDIDPIETVSSLCAQKTLHIDVPDKWMKTPLHYAAARSSTISTLYILQRGAQLEGKDIYGNTPLGIALTNKHINYGIILIQKGANVKVPIQKEFPKKIAKQWRLEKKLKEIEDLNSGQLSIIQANTNAEMNEEKKENEDKSHRKLFFQKQRLTNIFPWLGGFLDSDSEPDLEESSDVSEGSEMEIDVINNQNAFGAKFINPQERKRLKKLAKQVIDEDNEVVEPEEESKSTFRISIEHGQQGIAYLILDNGYNYMLAMNDALDEGKLQLVLTLLAKTADDAVIQRKNEKGQNLMHILAMNSKRCGQNQTVFDNMMRICHILRKRGVNCLEQDNLGNNALHYAVQCDSYQLVQVLIAEKIDVNAVNKDGHSPFSLYCTKNIGSNGFVHLSFCQAGFGHVQTILDLIVDAGANLNFQFPFKVPKTFAEMQEVRISQADSKTKPIEPEYKTTILINSIRFANQRPGGLGNKDFLQIRYLQSKGCSYGVIDSEGYDALYYAILNNDTVLVDLIYQYKDLHGLIVDLKDQNGNTAVHHCVQSSDFGSFENTEILDILNRMGFNLNLQNNQRQTPLDLSLPQTSGKMKEHLMLLLRPSHPEIGQVQELRQRKNSIPDEYPQSKFNFIQDSQLLLDEAEAKKAKELVQKGKEPAYVPVDIVIKNVKQYQIFYDEEKKPYDCYLTKVDLKNGLYGAYVFYKMQLLHDTVRDLYLLLTRYGRIGEQGMFQQTPFTKIEDAILEFRTVFKQKTSNEWASVMQGEFIKTKKKYNLVEVHYSNVEHKDYLAPFDFDNCKQAQGVCQRVLDFIETICNVTMYQKAIETEKVDLQLLPVSALKRDSLQKAQDILSEIQDVIKNDIVKISNRFLETDYEEKQRISERLSKLSSEFFELIPMKEQRNQITRVIYDQYQLDSFVKIIDVLKNVERVSRMLLGALYRQMQINPIQYIYEHVGAKIQVMDENDPESKLLLKLICNTSQNKSFSKLKLFKVWRDEEVQAFKEFQSLKNRQLLFHGTTITNYLGVLSQGLQTAPHNVQIAGATFGQGIYFADMFAKSDAYSNNSRLSFAAKTPNIMLLCEVALGNIKKVIYPHPYEKENLQSGFETYHSIKAYGRVTPDHKHARLISPQGFGVTATDGVAAPKILEHDLIKYDIQPERLESLKKYTYNNFNAKTDGSLIYNVEYNEYVVFNSAQVKIKYMVQYL